MPPKIIGEKVYLHARSPFGLSKDPRPKRLQVIFAYICTIIFWELSLIFKPLSQSLLSLGMFVAKFLWLI
jgi:hypothetical protein